VFPFADVPLARRIERTEGLACSQSAEARARLSPASGACWIEVAGARAVFDGPTSPVTQTFGLGLFDPVGAADLERIEAFFRERGAPVLHEVSPLADPALVALLNERGYQPFEFTSVLYRSIQNGHATAGAPVNGSLHIRQIDTDDGELWARTAAAGWSDYEGLGEFLLDVGRVNVETADCRLYLAELQGRPIATAALRMHDGVAFLAGASTIPDGRRRGAQLALLDRRLSDAAADGCDIAMMGALPGSGSQRNAERHGFRIAYTRVKWRKT